MANYSFGYYRVYGNGIKHGGECFADRPTDKPKPPKAVVSASPPSPPAADDVVDVNHIVYLDWDPSSPIPYTDPDGPTGPDVGYWDPIEISGAMWDYFKVTDASGT
jgi:hypothetical protein